MFWVLWRNWRVAYYCAEFLLNVAIVFGAMGAILVIVVYPFSPGPMEVTVPSIGLHEEPIEIASSWGQLLAFGVFLACLSVVAWMSRELRQPDVEKRFIK